MKMREFAVAFVAGLIVCLTLCTAGAQAQRVGCDPAVPTTAIAVAGGNVSRASEPGFGLSGGCWNGSISSDFFNGDGAIAIAHAG